MSSHLLRIVVFLIAAYGAPMAVHAQENSRPVSVDKIKQVGDMRVQLQGLVNGLGFHSNNLFCVIGYVPNNVSESPLLYVFWLTENKIIEWHRLNEPLLLGGNVFDLAHDILPDGAPTIDYLHKSDVIMILHDCRKHGTNYAVKRLTSDWVSVSHVTQFSSLHLQLEELIRRNKSSLTDNFCVVAQHHGNFLAAYIYWRTKHRLILWIPDVEDSDSSDALSDSIINIDLDKDLFNTLQRYDIYKQMQKSYAEFILNACRKYGDDFVILRSN